MNSASIRKVENGWLLEWWEDIQEVASIVQRPHQEVFTDRDALFERLDDLI